MYFRIEKTNENPHNLHMAHDTHAMKYTELKIPILKFA